MARRRRFEVEPIEGDVEVQRMVLSKDGVLKQETTTEKGGFMVYFPAGHSIRVGSKEELRRLGFHRQPGIIDDETLEEIKEDEGGESLKALSESKTAGRAAKNKFRNDSN